MVDIALDQFANEYYSLFGCLEYNTQVEEGPKTETEIGLDEGSLNRTVLHALEELINKATRSVGHSDYLQRLARRLRRPMATSMTSIMIKSALHSMRKYLLLNPRSSNCGL